MITIMTTICLQGRETDWGWGTLEFQTAPFKRGRALQTSTTSPNWPILSRELYPMAEGDMIQRNTGPQTTDTITHHMRQVQVLCTKCTEPFLSSGVFTTRHTSTSLLPIGRESLATLQSKRPSHCQIKDKGFNIDPCCGYLSVENQI